MKKLLALFLCLTAVSGLMQRDALADTDWPEGPAIQAESGILIDGRTGAVLYEKNADQAYYPASITKILTALIVIENSDLDDMITCSKEAIYNVEAKSSNAGLSEGDTLSVRDCLYALLVNSANEAANALAEHVAGSMDAFADMMNEKARELGCTNSHFANPSGLNNEDHYTTARDMALIAKAAFDNPEFVDINATTYYKLPPTKQDTEGLKMYAHHKMMLKSQSVYYPGIIGGKTGYTTLAGNTLVTAAERDGMRLITVILKGTTPAYYTDTSSLLDFGFKNFKNLNADDYKTSFYTVDNDLTILGIDTDREPYLILENNLVTVPKAADFADVTSSLIFDLSPSAPGNAAAGVEYKYGERTVGNAFLCINSSLVPESSASDSNSQSSAAPATAAEADPGAVQPAAKEPTSESSPAAPETPAGARSKAADATPKGNAFEGFTIPSIAWIIFFAVVGLGAVIGGLIALKIHLEKKEEAAQSVRREQRRQRLQELGYSASDFDALLQQKQSSYMAKRRKRGRFFNRRKQ